MDNSELSYYDCDNGYFRIELFRTGTLDLSEISFLGLG